MATSSMASGIGAIRALRVAVNRILLLLRIAPRADTSFAMSSVRGAVRVRTRAGMTTKRLMTGLPEMLVASAHAVSLANLPSATIAICSPAYVLKWLARASDGFVRTESPTMAVMAQPGQRVMQVSSCGTCDMHLGWRAVVWIP